MDADFLIEHADQLLAVEGPGPRCGPHQARVAAIRDGAVASLEGRIVFAGTTVDRQAVVTPLPGATLLDARGCTVVPGFVDPHTHVVYAGDRRGELQRRLAGATYAEIAAAGGGIVATVDATRRK